ncbi:glycosyltransferase WbpZ [Pseudomonas sp. Pc102]|uniref:glycosyltransferase family 4 protein n=1 Tax=Pseudomonas sp. Pc102 TaxID=2678261 RepID=UPI001BCE9E86|nr:glycosyltransferase family 4 protein [Pseudomonas sp. Pc102]BBP86047.1 glycosyltransferase WbpZ [Pseudomonas sp. Pc102]
MRVLSFYKTALPDSVGGVEQVISQLSRGANKLGVEVDILTTSTHAVPPQKIDGYMLHRAKLDIHIASTSFSMAAVSMFASLSKKADLIHYHFPWPFMDMVHFLTRVKKPTLLTYHSDIIRQKNLLRVYRPLKSAFLNNVNHIVATSPNYFATSDVLTKFKEKVSVIPIGLDKNSYLTPSSERLEYWRTLVGDRFFLFVGVLRYYKGLHILMEAAQGTDYPIVIIGAGPIELELKAQASRLGLNNVHFLGRLPEEDKVALLALCYSVVFPSHLRSEAFGVSLLEGAMYGKPMISSEIGTGTTFINIADETGLVVPPGDPLALRNAMYRLWNNPQLAAEMGKKAEARYWQNFTADQMVQSYVDLYKSLVK